MAITPRFGWGLQIIAILTLIQFASSAPFLPLTSSSPMEKDGSIYYPTPEEPILKDLFRVEMSITNCTMSKDKVDEERLLENLDKFFDCDPTDDDVDDSPQVETPSQSHLQFCLEMTALLVVFILVFAILVTFCIKRRRHQQREEEMVELESRKSFKYPSGLYRIDDRELFRKFCYSQNPTHPIFATSTGFDTVEYAKISTISLTGGKPDDPNEDLTNLLENGTYPVMHPDKKMKLVVLSVVHKAKPKDNKEEGSKSADEARK